MKDADSAAKSLGPVLIVFMFLLFGYLLVVADSMLGVPLVLLGAFMGFVYFATSIAAKKH